jgi:hypothetical protein
MRTFRTSDERFPDFGFALHFAEVPDGTGGTPTMLPVPTAEVVGFLGSPR